MELVERIARVIAGYRLSSNAEGSDQRAASYVDGEWPAHRLEALAILKSLREPSQAMVESGMSADWQALVERELAVSEAKSL